MNIRKFLTVLLIDFISNLLIDLLMNIRDFLINLMIFLINIRKLIKKYIFTRSDKKNEKNRNRQ